MNASLEVGSIASPRTIFLLNTFKPPAINHYFVMILNSWFWFLLLLWERALYLFFYKQFCIVSPADSILSARVSKVTERIFSSSAMFFKELTFLGRPSPLIFILGSWLTRSVIFKGFNMWWITISPSVRALRKKKITYLFHVHPSLDQTA